MELPDKTNREGPQEIELNVGFEEVIEASKSEGPDGVARLLHMKGYQLADALMAGIVNTSGLVISHSIANGVMAGAYNHIINVMIDVTTYEDIKKTPYSDESIDRISKEITDAIDKTAEIITSKIMGATEDAKRQVRGIVTERFINFLMAQEDGKETLQ